MSDQPEFDVFLAHNSLDKDFVRAISNSLKQRGLNPWLDEEEILPGQYFQDVIQRVIPQIKSAAIFIGALGLGKWQALEIKAFISQCVKRDIPVIPVLLPGVEEIPDGLIFLSELNWIKFSNTVDHEKTLDTFEKGIFQSKLITKKVVQSTDSSKSQKLIDQLYIKRETKELKVIQLTEIIGGVEKYLDSLRLQRSTAENELQQLQQEISQIELQLKKDVSEQISDLIDWLAAEQNSLAKKAGDYALSQFSDAALEIKNDDASNRLFYWTIEKLIEMMRYSLYSMELDFDSLMEGTFIPQYAFDIYIKSLDYIKIKLQRKIGTEEFIPEIDRSFNKVKESLEFLKDLSV